MVKVFTWSNMNIGQKGIELIKHFEGCELEAYKCPAGVWTIGYGHIKGVSEGMSITQEQAEQMLLDELKEYENYINELVVVDLSQNQFDALVAWTYNLGPTNLNNSTMLKVLNENKLDEVPAQMRRWNKAGNKVLEGLERRRLAESMLFENNPDWHEV